LDRDIVKALKHLLPTNSQNAPFFLIKEAKYILTVLVLSNPSYDKDKNALYRACIPADAGG
jgi:hypothetical protein